MSAPGMLDAGKVLARTGVNLYLLAFVYKQWDLQQMAGFQLGEFGGACGSVAFESGRAKVLSQSPK